MNQQNIPEGARASIARELSRYYDELAGNAPGAAPRMSFRRALCEMASGGLRDGYEKEICSGAAMIAGRSHDPHKVVFPFAAFRDLTASSASGGGYLVGTDRPEARDVLRPWSVVARAGVTMLQGLVGNLTYPQVIAAVAGAWLTAEAGVIGPVEPSFGEIAMTPKHAVGFTRFSRQLALQADAAEQVIRGQLLEAVSSLLDQAVIAGTGAGSQPLGITNTAGVGTQSGTSLAWSGIRTMRRQIVTAGGNQDLIAWIGAPDVQDVLSGRERNAGGGKLLWDDNGITGRPAYATANCPTGVLVGGDWSRVIVGIWGPGFVVEVNPFENFPGAKLSARVILECDVILSPVAAFSVAASVT